MFREHRIIFFGPGPIERVPGSENGAEYAKATGKKQFSFAELREYNLRKRAKQIEALKRGQAEKAERQADTDTAVKALEWEMYEITTYGQIETAMDGLRVADPGFPQKFEIALKNAGMKGAKVELGLVKVRRDYKSTSPDTDADGVIIKNEQGRVLATFVSSEPGDVSQVTIHE